MCSGQASRVSRGQGALRRGRVPAARVGVLTLVVLTAALLSWWAGWTVAAGRLVPDTSPAVSIAVAVEQVEIGRSVNVGVVALQPHRLVATNALSGTVTSLATGPVDPGETIYTVSETPVRAAAGRTPFYRDLARGARGSDVEQLQRMLVDLGYELTPDGIYGPGTESAVAKWQRSNGEDGTGIVPLGTLVAVPYLPTTVSFGEQIRVAAVVGGGEDAVFARTEEPRFELVLSSDQASLIPLATPVSFGVDGATWTAVTGGASTDESGNTVVALESADGQSICGERCELLPPSPRTILQGTAIVVPPVSGPGLPAGAVQTDATGSASVTLATGDRLDVAVVAAGEGLVILDGIDLGVQVLLPAPSSS